MKHRTKKRVPLRKGEITTRLRRELAQAGYEVVRKVTNGRTDPEVLALHTVIETIGELEPESQARVLVFVKQRFAGKEAD